MFKTIGTISLAGLRALGRATPTILIDLAGLGGVSVIAYGAWMIYPPAGFITGGVLLVAGAVVLGAKSARRGG